MKSAPAGKVFEMKEIKYFSSFLLETRLLKVKEKKVLHAGKSERGREKKNEIKL